MHATNKYPSIKDIKNNKQNIPLSAYLQGDNGDFELICTIYLYIYSKDIYVAQVPPGAPVVHHQHHHHHILLCTMMMMMMMRVEG